MPSVNDVVKIAGEYQAQLIADSMNDAHQAIMDDSIKGRLPENIFVDYFLPYFSGNLPINKTSKVLTDWISVAGSAVAEVDIIDREANVLFTVPPIMDTTVINPASFDSDHSLAGIYREYGLRANNLKPAAERFLLTELDTATDIITAPSSIKEKNTVVWDDIFKRYNIKKADEEIAKPAHVDEDDLADDMIYE